MKLLAIETSTELASVALAVEGEVFSEEQDCLRQHAHKLLPMIDRLLVKAAINTNQLDGIVFGRGPGSFTGLRIACSVAKGIACAHQLPLFPVSTLAAIAYDIYHTKLPNCQTHQVLALIDARMHQVYWGIFNKDNYETDEHVTESNLVSIPGTAEIVVAGMGYEHYIEALPLAVKKHIIQYNPVFPHAKALIQIALTGKINPVSAEQALPIYIRNQVTQGEKGG